MNKMSEDVARELLNIAKKNADQLMILTSAVAKIEGALEHFPDGAEVHSIVDAKLNQHVTAHHPPKSKKSLPPAPNVIIANAPAQAKWHQRIDWPSLIRWLMIVGASMAGLEGLKQLPF